MASELQTALHLVEVERARLLGCKTMTVDEIVSIGSVEYITQHWPEVIKKKAHILSMPIKQGDESIQELNLTPLEQAYKFIWLEFFRVQDYLDEVHLHIQKLQEIGKILLAGHDKLQHRFSVHDCSKFSYDEVYGYVLRWTHGLEDCPEWKVALDNHLHNNDHHPEFYRGKPMDELALIESCVDMLSWRLIKNRNLYPRQQVHQWLFDIEDKYLQRYVEEDRVRVRRLLAEWKNQGHNVNHL